MGCPAEERSVRVKCVIQWFISLAGISVLSVGRKLQRRERRPDTWNDVRAPSREIPEVADMPWLQNGHVRFLPAVFLWGLLRQTLHPRSSSLIMDPKGPSAAFKRSSLKRSTSGSQKVRRVHRHRQQVLLKWSICWWVLLQIRCGFPALIGATVYLEITSNSLWNPPSVQTVVSTGVWGEKRALALVTNHLREPVTAAAHMLPSARCLAKWWSSAALPYTAA